MQREPIVLYLFRFIIGLGLLALATMLYWSSTLIEQHQLALHSEIASLKRELVGMRSGLQGICDQMAQTVLEERGASHESRQKSDLSHLDPALPNLLEEDPFYKVTLPKLLGEEFAPSGTLRTATIGRPIDLHPFSGWGEVANWISLCVGQVATNQFGRYETLAPDMAVKMEARSVNGVENSEFWIHLRKDLFWQPLSQAQFSEGFVLAPKFLHPHPVTAYDFKFAFDAMMNPYLQESGAVARRNYFIDVEEFRVIDDYTFAVRWKRNKTLLANGKELERSKYAAKQLTGGMAPLPRFVYQYFADGSPIIEETADADIYRKDPVWAQNFANHWAKNTIPSCGPWGFKGITDEAIRFERNPVYHNPLAALTRERVVRFTNSPDTIWQEFKAGESALYTLRPEQQLELEQFLASDLYQSQKRQGRGIKQLDYVNRVYVYIGWNLATPYFASKQVRQAMSLAIDRRRIIEQQLGGMGVEISGPFYVHSANYNAAIAPWPYDPDRAERLLEEEGWYDQDGDGIRDKELNGKRVALRFKLTYYAKNPTTKAICDYVAAALRQIGVDCQLHGVDTSDLSAAFDDKNFDALLMGWSFGAPPDDPRQLWHSSGAKEHGSSNAVGFANKEADQIIEALTYEEDHDKRIALYHRFHAILHEEAPYTFLYTPKSRLLYREQLQNVFIPADRQDLIPGADVGEPQPSIFWLRPSG